ncbi:TlpA family protein disulfide reductase [Roseibium denhamense]|uniref:Thiol-disulfide isomerase or thioredoxin n=1 Tax=Roseibium denhamense TaxID=76305 RepID=A0ABY1PBQ7_9HYPH|nr:TlpA disulfide reductase family protein [Roseibium denhamense]MTI07537.1 TlpA family protein disulfide reductase [Roseibium denhamense]SMP30291.1 Thiol-disulfide isomerase or thioredoxin [Roseibium denhamense]
MTKPEEPVSRSKRNIVAAGIAGALAALAALYVIAGPDGNITTAQSCPAALQSAGKAKPFATGEVAAFLPASAPLDLTHLTFKNDKGETVTMADFKDKTVLLNLWATWCAPCRKEMPALDQLQQDMGGDQFEVVAVSLDRGGPAKPKDFLDEINVDTLAFFQDSSNGLLKDLQRVARATGLPTTILISPEGCEIGTMYGPAEWASHEAKALIDSVL